MATQEKTGYRMVVYWYLCGTYGSNYRKLVKVVRHAKKAIVGTSGDLRRAVCMILTLWIEVEGNQKAHCRKLLK